MNRWIDGQIDRWIDNRWIDNRWIDGSMDKLID